MSLSTSRCLPIALAVLLCGCVNTAELIVAGRDYNAKLRFDRAALDDEEIRADVASLAFGRYRNGPDDLVSPLIPAWEHAAHLPQSDCWWSGHDPLGGKDVLHANWEEVVEIVGDDEVLANVHDPEDRRLELGLCRLNDPETREPPQTLLVENPEVVELDCARVGNGTSLTQNDRRNFPTCLTDAVFLGTRLEALRTRADPFQRCPELLAGFDTLDRTIASGVDFYDGISARGLVVSCSAAQGQRLIPATPTRYRLRSQVENDNVGWLGPAVLPTHGGSGEAQRPGRTMTSLGAGAWIWATPVATAPDLSGRVRWQENFSASLRVAKVRLFRPDSANRRVYLAPTGAPPPLCLTDGSATCRWRCDGTVSGGQLVYDLLGGGACREGTASAVPQVTPTYAFDSATTREQVRPLEWSVSLAGSVPADPPWIEFELLTTFATAAMRAEPAAADLGGARTGEYRRGLFVVDNVGAHPLRITAVAMDPAHGGRPGDFRLQLPSQPLPVPLPVEVAAATGDKTTLVAGADAESNRLGLRHADHAHVRYVARRDGFATLIDGVRVNDDRGLLMRDVRDASFRFDPAHTPAARTTYTLRALPFDLLPGESFEVSVIGTPSGLGARTAWAKVSAHSVLDPAQRREVWVATTVYGLQGPLLHLLPQRLTISATGAGQLHARNLLIENAGDSNGSVGVPTLTRVGGGALPPGSRFALEDPYGGGGMLVPGASRVLTVRHTSYCGLGDWFYESAELRWPGVNGTLVVPIDTTTYCGP